VQALLGLWLSMGEAFLLEPWQLRQALALARQQPPLLVFKGAQTSLACQALTTP
jgi:hypothetical protein